MLWLLWAVILLTAYYKQLWRLPVIGPSAWITENYSLTMAREFWRFVKAGPVVWALPAFDEALMRALTGIFGALLVLLAAQLLGIVICQLLRWRPEDWRDGLLYQMSLGLGAISYLSLGLAALGIYYAVNVRLMIGGALTGGGAWVFYTRIYPNLRKQRIEELPKPISSNKYRADSIWQIITLIGIIIALVGALAPETENDALWYHLWLPKLWLDQGHSVDLIAEYISLYPLNWELLFGAGLVWGGPVAAKLLHFVCLPLTGLLTYQIVRRYLPTASPWLAVALFITIPTVLWEATTTYIDLALSFQTGLTIYALLRYVEERKWSWLLLGTFNLGLALATKHLALFVLILVVSGLALRLWLKERNLYQALIPALLLGGLSLLLPLPWYLRSWLAAGNPFFPDLYGIFGAFPPERWNEITEQGLSHFKDHFGDPRTLPNLLMLLWNMTVHAARYGGTFGPLFLLLIPALVLPGRTKDPAWILAFILLYIGFWASPISSFQMRFLVPITPLLAVLAAEACGRLVEQIKGIKGGKWIAFTGITGLLLLNLPPFISLHEGDREIWDGWLTHVIHEVPLSVVIGRESQEDYLARKVPSYQAWQYINTHLSNDARVLTFSEGDHFYSKRERLWSDATITRPAVWGASRTQEKQAFQALINLGVSHILFNKRQLDSLPAGILAIAQLSELTKWYQMEYEDSYFVLYRLNREQIMLSLANNTFVERQ